MSEHTHPNLYTKVFVALIAALGISLAIGAVSTSPAAIAVIFIIAGVKAFLVANYFMHVNVEARFVKVLLVSVILVLAVLFVGLVPDIVYQFGGMGTPS